jgi:hypothetical protein
MSPPYLNKVIIIIIIIKPKTNSVKRTFGYAAAKVWNERN